jgi:hypothetical protein
MMKDELIVEKKTYQNSRQEEKFSVSQSTL